MAMHDSHCGGTCMLKVHVRGDVITRIETDDGEEPQYRACLRGRAFRQRVYAPDRITYPLKRIGARGEGKFERIMPGVGDIPQGAWYDPDHTGVDKGGCANVLTLDEHSPGGTYPSNTSLVQIEKV